MKVIIYRTKYIAGVNELLSLLNPANIDSNQLAVILEGMPTKSKFFKSTQNYNVKNICKRLKVFTIFAETTEQPRIISGYIAQNVTGAARTLRVNMSELKHFINLAPLNIIRKFYDGNGYNCQALAQEINLPVTIIEKNTRIGEYLAEKSGSNQFCYLIDSKMNDNLTNEQRATKRMSKIVAITDDISKRHGERKAFEYFNEAIKLHKPDKYIE